MAEEKYDIREIMLANAGNAFINKQVPFGDDPYLGEDAVQIGFDLIDLVERLDREFSYKKKK